MKENNFSLDLEIESPDIHLILEDSPYLLQHAHNPIDWFTWGNEAFAKAKIENKPIFSVLGYSTCHWCHVMEEESFDDEEKAKKMNDFFVCIKVDRECHPDIDTYYMTALMIMQGHGGWPMSSFLTPEGKPFFCGTYYQPTQFITLIRHVNDVWNKQSTTILEQANSITTQVATAMKTQKSLNEIGTNIIDITATIAQIYQSFDTRYDIFAAQHFRMNPTFISYLNTLSCQAKKII